MRSIHESPTSPKKMVTIAFSKNLYFRSERLLFSCVLVVQKFTTWWVINYVHAFVSRLCGESSLSDKKESHTLAT